MMIKKINKMNTTRRATSKASELSIQQHCFDVLIWNMKIKAKDKNTLTQNTFVVIVYLAFSLTLLFYRGHAKPNETVLIHGASGGVSRAKLNEKTNVFLRLFKVGIAAVQLAKATGLRVIGTASTEQGLQAIRDQGADLVFNHKQEGYLKDIAVSVFHVLSLETIDRLLVFVECLC